MIMTNESTRFGKNDFEVTQKDQLYSGIFKLARYHIRHRLFQGGWSETFTRELLERYSAASVLPYDAKLDRVILIEQFRPGSLTDPQSPWLIEVPAGVLVGDATPESTAYSEAEEEAGCTVTELMPICEFYVSPGGSDEYINLYCGKADLSNVSGIHGLTHEHENIRVHNVTYHEAIKKLTAGEIKTAPAIVSLQWLQLNREKLISLWG
jgi:ADP-ribose pyrophosphatase